MQKIRNLHRYRLWARKWTSQHNFWQNYTCRAVVYTCSKIQAASATTETEIYRTTMWFLPAAENTHDQRRRNVHMPQRGWQELTQAEKLVNSTQVEKVTQVENIEECDTGWKHWRKWYIKINPLSIVYSPFCSSSFAITKMTASQYTLIPQCPSSASKSSPTSISSLAGIALTGEAFRSKGCRILSYKHATARMTGTILADTQLLSIWDEGHCTMDVRASRKGAKLTRDAPLDRVFKFKLSCIAV